MKTSPPDASPQPRHEGSNAGLGGSREGGESGTERVTKEVASDVRAAVAPVGSAMRADVGRLTSFIRGIQSGYLKSGLALLAVTSIAGVLVTVLTGFSDWYMHLAMYLVLFAFVLLYVRAHLRGFRIMAAIWALVATALLGFFAWVLIDLVPARLDVLSGRVRPEGFTGPEVALRDRADWLWLPALLLVAQALWLVVHGVFVGRFRERRTR